MKQPRIVVLDDQHHMHDIYDLCIRHAYPLAEIAFCFNGHEALREIRRQPPTLLITDLNHSGPGLTELSANINFPVLVISNSSVRKVDSMGSHVHFLPKPFRLDAFINQLRQLVRV